jgi:mycothiol synthase
VNVEVLHQLDSAQQSALDALVARCEEADQHPALSEELRDPAGRIDLPHHAALAVLAEMGDDLVGCATLTPGADGLTSLHLAIDPSHRCSHSGERGGSGGGSADDGEIRTTLINRALAEATQPVRLWILLAGEDDDRAMAKLGFRPERDLLQMRVTLPLPPEVVAAARPVETRSFVIGQDEEAWLAVNNRAFAGHPEQGNWTLDKLRGREEAEWFDPSGFLIAADIEGRGFIGSCWTKVHRHRTPMLGEIYVVSVEPSRHGEGWGRALTVAGLQWLSAQGLTVGMLYTGSTNSAAVALYGSLGFVTDHVDRSYLAYGGEELPQPIPVPMARPTP